MSYREYKSLQRQERERKERRHRKNKNSDTILSAPDKTQIGRAHV